MIRICRVKAFRCVQVLALEVNVLVSLYVVNVVYYLTRHVIPFYEFLAFFHNYLSYEVQTIIF